MDFTKTILSGLKVWAEGKFSALNKEINNKVDLVDGKGLSTEDFTTENRNKLINIEFGANKTIVDTSLSSTSTNPVQNKVINEAILKNKPNAIANDEIDVICAVMFDYNDIFADATTGEIYKLYVQHGKLNMIKMNTSAIENHPVEEFLLADITTGSIYRMYANDGKLSMIEDTNSVSSFNELLFVDISEDATYKLYVDNAKLIMMEVE